MLGNPAYPTYQVFLAILVSALIAGLVMPLWIRLLKIDGIGQQIRADGPQSHLVKAGTPTMGGVIILLAVCLTCLIMAKPTTELFLAVGAMLATGALGLFDDVTKVVQKRSLGLTPTGKMIGLTAIVLVFFVIAVNFCDVSAAIRFPGRLRHRLGRAHVDVHLRRYGHQDPVALPHLCVLAARGYVQRRQPHGRPRRTRRRYGHDGHARHGRHLLPAR